MRDKIVSFAGSPGSNGRPLSEASKKQEARTADGLIAVKQSQPFIGRDRALSSYG